MGKAERTGAGGAVDGREPAGEARLLGSLASESAGAALVPLLRDGDPLVRLTAASTLGTIGYRDAAGAMRDAAERAEDPLEREQLDRIATALGG